MKINSTFFEVYIFFVADFPKMRDNKKRTMKIKNKILAIEAAPAAIPPNPNTAAIIATMRKVTVQRNMILNFIVRKYDSIL